MSEVSFLEGRVTLYVGDCLAMLATMPSDSVDCVVTSPPYWGLRDYGVDGQIGLEPTLAEHLAIMVVVFREIRRVLKPTGTLWINYGDCYATSPNGRSAADTKATGKDDRTFRDKPFSTIGPIYDPEHSTPRGKFKSGDRQTRHDQGGRIVAGGYLKAKDLCMVPNRLAIALQDDGWWVRSEIIWAKPNPMPESIRDRPATSHEKIFLLSKSARYFYEAEAVRQNRVQDEDANTFRGGSYVGGQPGKREVVGNKRVGKQDATAASAANAGGSSGRRMSGFNERWDAKEKLRAADLASPRHAGHINHTKLDATPRGFGRNLRNYEPAPVAVWPIATQPFSDAHFATFPPELAERCILAGCPKGGLVLDPFGGAGTTALVALRHGRRASLIELNPEYAAMSRRRVEAEWRVQPKIAAPDFGPLFGGEAA